MFLQAFQASQDVGEDVLLTTISPVRIYTTSPNNHPPFLFSWFPWQKSTLCIDGIAFIASRVSFVASNLLLLFVYP